MFKRIFNTVFIAILTATLMTSCITNRITPTPNSSTISALDDDRIEILGPVKGSAGGGRVWVLFIPIGFAKDSWCNRKAYKNALKTYPNADGLIDQSTKYHRTRIPLIVVTPVVKKVTVTGVAYHIRTDIELAAYRKTKQD